MILILKITLSKQIFWSKSTNIYMQPIDEVDKQVASTFDSAITDLRNNKFIC